MFKGCELVKNQTEFEYFKEAYEDYKSENEYWVMQQLKNKQGKNENKSESLRIKGNSYFQRKEYFDCCHYYTRSLCYAVKNSANYGLALANRSAALFHIGDFENCLKDIETCLKTEYPLKLYPKVLLRRCYCLYRLKGEKSNELKNSVELALKFINDNKEFSPKEKDALKKQFKPLDFGKVPAMPQILNISDMEIPPLKDDENANFAYASSSVEIRYEKSKGRHVVAVEDIKRGDVIFVETAFFVALPLAKKSDNQTTNKCYQCLKDVRAPIPCPTCTLFVFCDEKCYQNSWLTIHKYECVGMQADIWYELGAAYPAFRAICLGMRSQFAEVKSDEIAQFGNKTDNYRFFNSLLSHWNCSRILVSSSQLIGKTIEYLKQWTTFFEDLPREIDEYFIGGLLLRHLFQIVCNASTIQHWNFNSTRETIPKDFTKHVACGMFPSISLMNHSCIPNINIIYTGNTAVVRAIKDINKNEEVFNCYGLDYGPTSVIDKSVVCRERYNFYCACPLCANPTDKDHVLENKALYKCPHCEFAYEEPLDKIQKCLKCHESLSDFIKIQGEALYPLFEMNDSDKELNLLAILKCQEAGEKIFTKLHPFYAKLYEAFWKYFLQIGNLECALRYIKLLVQEQTTIVREPRRAAVLVFYALKQVHTFAEKGKMDLEFIEEEIDLLRQECITVLQLYYPFSQESLYRCMTT